MFRAHTPYRRLSFAALISLIVCAASICMAQAPASNLIEAGASQNHFYIEPDFDGSSVVLFGAIDREGTKNQPFDLAITIRGPEKPVTVWQKERRFGVWINSKSAIFQSAPSFYAVMSTKPVEELASLDERKKYEIGIDTLPLQISASADAQENLKTTDDFRSALIRIQKSAAIFVEKASSIEFLGKSLFRTRAYLPASAGPGVYHVKVFLFQNGKMIGSAPSKLRVKKVGIEAFLSRTSGSNPWLYGAGAVLLAAFIGSGASLVFGLR